MVSLVKNIGNFLISNDKKYKQYRLNFYICFSLFFSLYTAVVMYRTDHNIPTAVFAFVFLMAIFGAYYGLSKLITFAAERNQLFLKYSAIFLIIVSLPFVFYFIIQGIEHKNVPLIDLNTDQWVGIFGGVLGYIGSCLLGALALYQNDKQRIENIEAQKRLEEANVRAEKINERLLQLEEAKYIPIIDIVTCIVHHDDERENNANKQLFAFRTDEANAKNGMMFDCKNVGEAYISKIDIEFVQMKKDGEICILSNWTKSCGSTHINVGMKKAIAFESVIDKHCDIEEILLSLQLHNLLGESYTQQFNIILGSVSTSTEKTIVFTIDDKIVTPPKKYTLECETAAVV